MQTNAILPILIFIFLTTVARTQETSEDKKIHISLFSGISLLGPKNDIEDQMVASGLDDTSNSFFGTVEHPKTTAGPAFDLEATYYTKENQGISLILALANNIEVDGFELPNLNTLGNFLFLNSKIWSASLNYVYSSSSKRHQLAAGPSLIIHRAKDTARSNTSTTYNNVKPGLYLGYSLNIIHKKSWFLLFKTNYRWAPDSEIGPFVAEGFGGSEDSTFPATKVSLSVLNVGFGVGIRFGNQ